VGKKKKKKTGGITFRNDAFFLKTRGPDRVLMKDKMGAVKGLDLPGVAHFFTGRSSI